MNKLRSLLAILSLGALGLLGCGAAEEDSSADDSDLIMQTIVRRDAHGEMKTTIKQISRAQQRTELAARQAATKGGEVGTRQQAVIAEVGCSWTGLWLFDGPEATGQMLCLDGNLYDETRLRQFCHRYDWRMNAFTRRMEWTCVERWNGRVRSYLGGDKPGVFMGQDRQEEYSPYEYAPIAGIGAQTADRFYFGSIIG